MRTSVLIPTFRRPEGFLRAARSVLAQQGAGAFELVGIDNSPEHSAQAVFDVLAREAAIPVRFAQAPQPGVANARNAALRLARGRYVAWLDDDEEAPPHWLAALIAMRETSGAQSVFGPVRVSAPVGAPDSRFYEQLYERRGPGVSGPVRRAYGMGNSLQPRTMFETDPFDPRANETGGEDDRLFAQWADAGARFAWAEDAAVTEYLTAARLTLAHALKRALAYGQAPCETAWSQRQYLTLARHLAVGAGQATVFGLSAALAAPLSRAAMLAMLDRAARGAGKLTWYRTQRFYGDAA